MRITTGSAENRLSEKSNKSRRPLGHDAGGSRQYKGEMASPLDQAKGKVVYLKAIRSRIRIYNKKFSDAGMTLPLLRALHIIDQSEIVLPGGLQIQRHLVGNTQEFNRIVINPAFDVLIRDAIDLDLTMHCFKNSRVIIVGEFRGGQLDGDELRFIIMPQIKLRLHLLVGLVLHKIIQHPVTKPVK
jgi:hypothetical protein